MFAGLHIYSVILGNYEWYMPYMFQKFRNIFKVNFLFYALSEDVVYQKNISFG